MLPVSTPDAIRAFIARCLTKDPRNRLQAIGEARMATERWIAQPELLAPPAEGRAFQSTTGPPWWRVLAWSISGAALAGAGLAWLAPWQSGAPAPMPPQCLTVTLGADASLVNGPGDAVALSADGSTIAFVAQPADGGPVKIYVRSLSQLQARALSGTDDAHGPFFSPDGERIGFFAGGKLKTVSTTGGDVLTVCDAPNGRGGAWAKDGTIVFSPDYSEIVGLKRVSSAGGTPEQIESLADRESTQRWPQILPGGRGVLYASSTSSGDLTLVVQPLPGGAEKRGLSRPVRDQRSPAVHPRRRGRGGAVSTSIAWRSSASPSPPSEVWCRTRTQAARSSPCRRAARWCIWRDRRSAAAPRFIGWIGRDRQPPSGRLA